MTEEATCLSAEEIRHFEDLARQFADRSVSAFLQGEFSDGDPARLGEVFDTAFDIGIAKDIRTGIQLALFWETATVADEKDKLGDIWKGNIAWEFAERSTAKS